MPSTTLRIISSLASIAPAQWDALACGQPLLSHAFLHALHETGCASADNGWLPQYVTAWSNDMLIGAMPLYVKGHSYGEYVFDWAWADAYRRHGRRYYPKLLSAIPFTPATGSRLLTADASTQRLLIAGAIALLREHKLSSLHVLFPLPTEEGALEQAGLLLRHGMQFHWRNPGYRDFADFLATMNHDKRKKIKQERRKLSQAGGVTFRRLEGAAVGDRDWQFFFRCYRNTYRLHHSDPYLTLDFFRQLGRTMPQNLLMVIGEKNGQPIAAAFNIFNGDTLWGRYWGSLAYLPGLHFETCYYQAIEFCIERGIALFEGGAQGVHKLARGFLPVATYSAHLLADAAFARAIGEFIAHEQVDLAHTIDELEERSPFRNQGSGIGNQ